MRLWYNVGMDASKFKIIAVLALLVVASGCSDSSETPVPDEVDVNVYTASEDGEVHRLNTNGSRVWSYSEFEDAVTDVEVDSTGSVYATTIGITSLHKIDSNGEQIWTYEEPQGWARSVDVGQDVYVSSDSVHKVTPDGEQVWTYEEHFEAVMGLAADGGAVYTASEDRQVHRVSSEGEQEWVYEEHSEPVYDVAVDSEGNVYTAAGDGVHKISSEGDQVWTYDGHGGPNVGGVTVRDGLVYTVGDSQQLHVLDAESGDRSWTYSQDVWINDVAVDDAGYVYTAGNNGQVHKIDPRGDQVWTYEEHSGHVEGIAVETVG